MDGSPKNGTETLQISQDYMEQRLRLLRSLVAQPIQNEDASPSKVG